LNGIHRVAFNRLYKYTLIYLTQHFLFLINTTCLDPCLSLSGVLYRSSKQGLTKFYLIYKDLYNTPEDVVLKIN